MPSTAGPAVVPRVSRIAGRLRVPGDKSISHRYAMLAAIADGPSRLHGYAPGADCAATLACLEALGVSVRRSSGPHGLDVEIDGLGLRGLRAPAAPLDAANSGTSMRLLSGLAAAHPFRTVISGDASLSRRPMRRVIEPLTKMGATIVAVDGRPPLTIDGADLTPIRYAPEVPSAQVKSAVLLAGLHAAGRTEVVEPTPTRDHTERAFEAFGVHVERDGRSVAVDGGQPPARGRSAHAGRHFVGHLLAGAWRRVIPGRPSTSTVSGSTRRAARCLDVLREAGSRSGGRDSGGIGRPERRADRDDSPSRQQPPSVQIDAGEGASGHRRDPGAGGARRNDGQAAR